MQLALSERLPDITPRQNREFKQPLSSIIATWFTISKVNLIIPAMNPVSLKKPIITFYLFGTPEIEYHGQPFILPRRQARALLYRLAAANNSIPREVLADLLWPNKSPATARRNLTRMLSYLRGQLPHPDLLQVSKAAVFLHPDLASSDIVHFSKLCTSDSPPDWETAVSYYRGPFLAGVTLNDSPAFDHWLSREQRQFEHHYLETLRRLVTNEAAEPEKAIQFARMYLEIDDLAEDIHRQLITLYAADGDRGAALRQFEQCVIVLEREFGVPPLPETRIAYEAARDSRQPAPPPQQPKLEWATLPGLDLPLIGREEAWEKLETAYSRFQSGGAIFISGEPGVGKSRLMQDFATAHATLTLTGNNPLGSQTMPYEPLVQALRLALPLPDRWRHVQPIWLAEAARLLPELRVHFPGLPAAVEVEPAQVQARLFEALTQLFRSLATDSSLLLCLDDVHWTDETTLGWLQYVTKRLAGSQICLIATYRTHEADPLHDWRWALGRANLMADVKLDGLSAAAVATLLVQANENIIEPARLAKRIHAATGGNAFFVLEIVRELLETNQLTNPPSPLPLPSTVRDAILRRTGRLSPLAQQILEITAVLSPLLTFPTIKQVAGRGEMETVDSLEELVAHQLLLANGNQFQFQHDLAREAIYQQISSWRRRLLHRRAGDELGKVYASRLESIAAQRAQHYDLAAEFERAVEAYELAAVTAGKLYAFEETIANFQRAIELANRKSLGSKILTHLYESLADIFQIIGHMEEAETYYRQALLNVSQEDPLKLAQLKRKLASSLVPRQLHDQAVLLYREALEALNEGTAKEEWQSDQLNILLLLSDALYQQQKIVAMRSVINEAAPLLEKVGSKVERAKFCLRQNQIAQIEERWRLSQETIELADQALSYARQSENIWLIGSCKFVLGFNLLWYGNHSSAEAWLRDALTIAKNRNDLWLQSNCLSYLSILHRLSSKIVEVQGDLLKLEKDAKYKQYPDCQGIVYANNAWLHYRRGEWSLAQIQAERASIIWTEIHFSFSWLAEWIILSLALRQNRQSDANTAARAMLNPKQQKLPNELEAVLQTAVTAYNAHDEVTARACWQTAVNLATRHGYL